MRIKYRGLGFSFEGDMHTTYAIASVENQPSKVDVGCRNLVAHILIRAVLDGYSNNTGFIHPSLRAEARAWLSSTSNGVGSAVYYCDLIDIDHEYLVRLLKKGRLADKIQSLYGSRALNAIKQKYQVN